LAQLLIYYNNNEFLLIQALTLKIIALKIIIGILGWLAGLWLCGIAFDSVKDTPEYQRLSEWPFKKKKKK